MVLCSKCNLHPKHLKLSYCKDCHKKYMVEYKKTKKGKESKKKSDKKYYEKNKEKIQSINKQWKENNLERFYEINKEWTKNNPEKIKEIQKRYRKTNPYYKIRNLFHNLKKQNFSKSPNNSLNIIKEHIEDQFSHEMDWGNIEIDHKIPISWFIKETPIQLINDLRNLHPLNRDQNRKKAASYCDPISLDYYNEILKFIKNSKINLITYLSPDEEV